MFDSWFDIRSGHMYFQGQYFLYFSPLASVFSPILLSGSSGIAVSCCGSVLEVCPVSYFRMRGFQPENPHMKRKNGFFRFICLFWSTLFSLRAS